MATGEEAAPCVPVKHRGCLKSGVKIFKWHLFMAKLYTVELKNAAFSPSSSSFVMVIVHPMSTLTTKMGRGWGDAEKERGRLNAEGIKKEVTG